MDQAPEDKSFGPCMTFKMDRHEDPFIVIQNRVYNDTLVCEPPTHYICQQAAMRHCMSLLSHITFMQCFFTAFAARRMLRHVACSDIL